MNAGLMSLNIVPLGLLHFGLYIVGLVAIGVTYLIFHTFSLSIYNLKHVKRVRFNLYVEWPVSFLVVFLASFLSAGWSIFILLIVLAYHAAIGFRLSKLMVQSYYSNKSKDSG